MNERCQWCKKPATWTVDNEDPYDQHVACDKHLTYALTYPVAPHGPKDPRYVFTVQPIKVPEKVPS